MSTGSKSDGRTAWQGSVSAPPMRAVEPGALGGLPPRARACGGRSGLDAPDRLTPSRTAVLRLAADDVRTQQGRPWGQPEAGAAADARDGDRSFGSAPRYEQSRAWTQDISLPAAGPGDHRAEPRVGFRHHLYPDGARLSVSRGDHRLGQPGGSGLAAVEHHRQRVLRRSAGGGSGTTRQAEDIQHGSGRAVHQRRVHRQEAAGVAISMDGRGRFMDNIFIERLWRSIKYEEVHLKAYADGREGRAGIGS